MSVIRPVRVMTGVFQPIILIAVGNWPRQLAKLVEKDGGSGTPIQLDAVIDSAGGDIMVQVNKILKPGGRVVVYGM